MELDKFLRDLYHPDTAERAPVVSALVKQMTGWESGRDCMAMGKGKAKEETPMHAHLRFCGNDWPCDGYTMVGVVRLVNVAKLMHSVIEEGVPGAFAELGVWRGGACIFARKVFDLFAEEKRQVHVFDAFEALPGYRAFTSFLENSQVDVEANFEREGALSERVTFHKGLFKDSLPVFRREHSPHQNKIAILRVDGNFYDSYQDAMYYLYEFVPVGGYVIFDDIMTHPSVMRFWNDFKQEQGVPEEMIRIDRHSAYFRKVKEVKIDMALMHAPQDANK